MSDRLDRFAPSLSEEISALIDGELPSQELQRVAEQWRTQASVRADWYTFHLIGDVLRSEDLASTASHDSRFLKTFTERLAGEPVVLAPASMHAKWVNRLTRPWLWSSAAAIGSVVMGATLWLGLTLSPAGAPEMLTSVRLMPPISSSLSVASGSTSSGLLPPLERYPRQGDLLRDAQLDHYLAAHQQFVGTSALGAPSGFIRNVAVDIANRR